MSDSEGKSLPEIITKSLKLTQFISQLNRDILTSDTESGRLINTALQELFYNLKEIEYAHSLVEPQVSNSDALIETAALLNSSLELDTVLNEVMDTIIRLTGAQRGYLLLRDPDSQEFSMQVARNLDRETINSTDFQISRSIIDKVEATGEPILTTNAQEDSRFNMQDSIVAYNLLSILCVPLKFKDQLTGIIYTDNKFQAGLFTDDTKSLLSAFGNQAAIAIENARLFDDLRDTLNEINEMKSLLDNVFSSIPSGVITLDEDNMIEMVNLSASRILEAAPRTLLGQNVFTAMPQFSEKLQTLIQIADRTEKTIKDVDLEYTRENGEALNLIFGLSPLLDEENLTTGNVLVVDDITEKIRREKQIAGVKRYLPPEVIDGIQSAEDLKLGGSRCQISVLFADIRGFSTFSENLDPEILVDIINTYMTIASDAIHAHEGIIDKFMGDAVMALYNTPLRMQEDHAVRAVKSGLLIREELQKYNRTIDPEWRLDFGIGIHSGEAIVGNVGSPERLEYTAMGDTVNISKRLQESAKPNQILISDETLARLHGQFTFSELGPISLKGRSNKILTYDLEN